LLARRESESRELLEQLAPVERLDIAIRNRLDMRHQAGFEASLVLWRGERGGIALMLPQRIEQAAAFA
jgi:hypothetical protein